MNRVTSFLLGLCIGGVLMFGSLKYHFVQSEDGFHFVPKLEANFNDTYVDVRQFHYTDWQKHRSLTVALMKAEKGHLVQDSAVDSLEAAAMDGFRNSIRGALEVIGE